MNKPFVGILVNNSWYRRVPTGRAFHESLSCYERAGRQHGLTPCFFRLQDLRPGQKTVRAYVYSKGHGYRLLRIPAPNVIHNRTLYTDHGPKRKIRRLVRDGKRIFNEWNRYGKGYIHNLLMEDTRIRPHLPETHKATPATLKTMMASHDKLILKPNSSSIGLGIMKLEKQERGWLLFGPARRKQPVRFGDRLPAIARRKMKTRPYLVQQLLPLATYRGKPFDLRVSVQRNETGDWQVTGMVAKVARKNAFRTNVAQGGTVYKLEQVLEPYPKLNADTVRNDVERFALLVAQQLSGRLPHLADIGLDIGLTEHGFPMFIECNGRDLRYSFKEGNLPKTFQLTYSNPIGYAKYLLGGTSGPKLNADFETDDPFYWDS